MEKTQRNSIYLSGKELKKFIFTEDEKYFIELTEWSNREGYTVSIHTDLGVRTFELSAQELNAIKFMADNLDYT